MKFEIIDNKGKVVFNTTQVTCIPNKDNINSMHGAGYKFKIDNKSISKKKLIEFITSNKPKRSKNE